METENSRCDAARTLTERNKRKEAQRRYNLVSNVSNEVTVIVRGLENRPLPPGHHSIGRSNMLRTSWRTRQKTVGFL